MLNDVRLLVVEYKGAHLAETPDAKENVIIREIWARLSKVKALFLLVVKNKHGKSIEEQISDKIIALGRR
jgi:type III restriction enzyme